MLTPATRASSTSEPPVIMEKAFWTQVMPWASLDPLPLLDATTHGLTLLGVNIVGPCPELAKGWPNSVRGMAAAATPAAVVVRTKSRRFSFFINPRITRLPDLRIGEHVGGDDHTLRFGRSLIN